MELSNKLIETTVASLLQIINDVKLGHHFELSTIEAMANDFISELAAPEGKGVYIPAKDPSLALYPIYHSIRVTALTVMMASRSGFTSASVREIAEGALLHDIGKINTPDQLIWKQKGGDSYEMLTIAEHPTFGAHWIGTLVILPDTIKKIIEEHHERYDGKGYPNALPEQRISKEAKIVSICNSYDYLTAELPGKPAEAPRNAMLHILRQAGTGFSPKLVQNFLSTMVPILLDGPLYQPSALVLLDSKEVAAIMKIDHLWDATPEIVILTDANQKKLLRPLTVSLKKDTSRKIVKIIKTT